MSWKRAIFMRAAADGGPVRTILAVGTPNNPLGAARQMFSSFIYNQFVRPELRRFVRGDPEPRFVNSDRESSLEFERLELLSDVLRDVSPHARVEAGHVARLRISLKASWGGFFTAAVGTAADVVLQEDTLLHRFFAFGGVPAFTCEVGEVHVTVAPLGGGGEGAPARDATGGGVGCPPCC